MIFLSKKVAKNSFQKRKYKNVPSDSTLSLLCSVHGTVALNSGAACFKREYGEQFYLGLPTHFHTPFEIGAKVTHGLGTCSVAGQLTFVNAAMVDAGGSEKEADFGYWLDEYTDRLRPSHHRGGDLWRKVDHRGGACLPGLQLLPKSHKGNKHVITVYRCHMRFVLPLTACLRFRMHS